MSQGSHSGSQQLRYRRPVEELQTGPLTGLPLIPCPRCGHRVLELRNNRDGSVFFKCSQNLQDVPRELRACGYYNLADEYAQVVASRLYGRRLNAERDVPVGQRASTSSFNLAQVHVEQRSTNQEMVQENLKDGNLSQFSKMEQLINLCKLILVSNVVVAVLVSLVLAILFVK